MLPIGNMITYLIGIYEVMTIVSNISIVEQLYKN